jgi:actin-related protein
MEDNAIVIDCGTYCCRVGFGGEDTPYTVIRTQSALKTLGMNPGTFSLENVSICRDLWEYLLREELHVSSRDYSVLVTEPPWRQRQEREDWSEVWFEHFSVPALHMASQPLLALYASGKTSGLVVYSGQQYTDILPVIEGYVLSPGQRVAIGGQTITDYLGRLIRKYRGPIRLTAEHIQELKENMCYVAKDYLKEAEHPSRGAIQEYEFPDGKKLTVGDEKFKAPELLFKPAIAGKDCRGLTESLLSAVNKTDIDARHCLYSNIIVAGGNTSFNGFDERLLFELKEHVPLPVKLRLHNEQNRGLAAWLGGSIMTSLGPCWQHFWITKDMYEEIGPSVIHRKSF